LVSWPMNTSRYLYGVYFFNFIHDVYGEQKMQAFIENYSDNLLPFAIDRNAKQVFGKSLKSLWEEFKQYLAKEFLPEIDRIKQQGVTQEKQLTRSGYLTLAPTLAPNGDLYFIEENMQDESRLMVIRKGKDKPETITLTHGSHFDIDPKSGIILTELNNYRNTNLFSDIYQIDPVSGEKTQLTHGKRYLYAAWTSDGEQIIAVHNSLGKQSLHLLNKKGELLKILWQGNDETVLGPPDGSPDNNQLVFSVWRPGSQWNLELFNINTQQWRRLTNDQDIETTPKFTTAGKEIIYSADYGGVFNIQRMDLASGKISTLTNVLGVAFSPAETTEGELYYISDNGSGFDLSTLSKKELHPVNVQPTDKEPPPHATTQTNETATTQKQYTLISEYNPLPLILPTGWFPYLYADKNRTDIGVLTWGSDPLFRHTYGLSVAYDAKNKWNTGRIDYLYDRWDPSIKLSIDKQVITYLDSSNLVERYRDRDTYTFEAMWPIFSYEKQWLLHAGMVYETESDRKIISDFGSLADQTYKLTGIALSFNSTHHLPDSISQNFGRMVRTVAENIDSNESYNSGKVYTVDWREYIDLPGLNVFYIRGVLGNSSDIGSHFRLGGNEDTSISPLPGTAAFATTQGIFGHKDYPLRGYPKGRDDMRGRRMFLADLEWRYPIIRLERGLIAPPVGVHQIHGKLFYTMGKAWNSENDDHSLRRGAGAEVTTELTLGYWIPVNTTVGVARGFDKGGENQAYLSLQLSI